MTDAASPLPSSPRPSEILVVSMPFVSGYRILQTLGFTYGLVVRSRGLGRNIVAGFRSIAGGEITEFTQLLEQTRNEALARLRAHAQSMGANAVLSARFDSSEMGEVMTEILAYGTAVVIAPDATPPQGVSLR
ncbi:MAG TPA: heavy metal-binding domain-containing protein [Thermoplasmata archaeon]|nr:heavy metal-binding domain-containing protein [Thermoplasmata archaeon]